MTYNQENAFMANRIMHTDIFMQSTGEHYGSALYKSKDNYFIYNHQMCNNMKLIIHNKRQTFHILPYGSSDYNNDHTIWSKLY